MRFLVERGGMMRQLINGGKLVMILVAAGVLVAGPVLAKKSAWSENEKFEKQAQKEDRSYEHNDASGHQYGDDHGKNEYGPLDQPGNGKNEYAKPDKGKKVHGTSGKSGKGKKGPAYSDDSDHGQRKHAYFKSRDRAVIHDYFAEEFHAGRCPPGLAKKGNGCMPPGQAKKWQIGHQLPREVIFHDLPPRVLRRLDPAPSRHRYVRVAQDILLITVGAGIVVDAIEDLGNVY